MNFNLDITPTSVAREPTRFGTGNLTRRDLLDWLCEEDPVRLNQLWSWADETRRRHVGDAVQLRGLIEISNQCARQCAYCGLRASNIGLARYQMTKPEILESAEQAVAFGYGTVVLQAGESPEIEAGWVAEVVRAIKRRTGLAVTLSLGERAEDDLAFWRDAGPDRYLLRFETSDLGLFRRIHPPAPGKPSASRIALLRRIKALGYETGSGIMVGLPGQTFESVANDLAVFRELDLDMIGIGPFIPHPATPLGRGLSSGILAGGNGSGRGLRHSKTLVRGRQVPNTELMVYKVVALARLLRPDANIPSTTALATINKMNGRELGLQRGANVLMQNLTPLQYRSLYEIYPAKVCLSETGDACNTCLKVRISALGRTVGAGPGSRGSHSVAHATARFSRAREQQHTIF